MFIGGVIRVMVMFRVKISFRCIGFMLVVSVIGVIIGVSSISIEIFFMSML